MLSLSCMMGFAQAFVYNTVLKAPKCYKDTVFTKSVEQTGIIVFSKRYFILDNVKFEYSKNLNKYINPITKEPTLITITMYKGKMEMVSIEDRICTTLYTRSGYITYK